MNRFFKYILPLAVLFLTAPVLQAQKGWFAGQGSGGFGTNFSYYVANAMAGATPVINYLNGHGDTAGSDWNFYTMESPLVISTAVSVGANVTYDITTNPTNSLTAGDIILVRGIAAGTFQRYTVLGLVDTNTFSVTNKFDAPTNNFAIVAGDLVYVANSAATIPIGDADSEIGPTSAPIFVGQEGYPLLVEVDGIGTNSVGGEALKAYVVSGEYR